MSGPNIETRVDWQACAQGFEEATCMDEPYEAEACMDVAFSGGG